MPPMQIPIIQARFNSARDMAPGGIKTIPAGRSIPRARAFKSAAQSAPEAMSGPRIVMGASCALPRRVLGMFRKGGSGAGSRVGGRNPLAGLGVYLVGGLQAERAMTVLFVTHQPEDAHRIAEAVVFLEDGKVAAAGDAETFFGGAGPEAFQRYIGSEPANGRSRDVARKRT